jgi:hypothetical protein
MQKIQRLKIASILIEEIPINISEPLIEFINRLDLNIKVDNFQFIYFNFRVQLPIEAQHYYRFSWLVFLINNTEFE